MIEFMINLNFAINQNIQIKCKSSCKKIKVTF